MLRRKLASIALTGALAVSLLAMPVSAAEVQPETDEASAESTDTETIEEVSETTEKLGDESNEISDDEIGVVSDDGINLLADTVDWTTTCTGQGVSITITSYTDQTYSFTSEDGASVSAVLTKRSQSSITVGSITRTEYGKTYTVTMDEIGQHILDINGSVSGSTNFYLEVLDHTYTTVVTEPTCTEKGYTEYTCSRCGYSYESDETDALGHSWDIADAQTAWTESDDAWTYSVEIVCTRCHTIASASDTPEGIVIEPTCTDEGSTTYTVSDLAVTDPDTGDVIATFSDKKVLEKSALGHDWGDWEIVIEATIGEDGEENRACSRCDAVEAREYQVDMDALDKEYDELLSEADELNADNYTEDSWNAFIAALEDAKEVLENLDSTQEDLDAAMSNLQAAFEGLIEKEEDLLNGVCKASDGKWYYYVDGVVDTSYTGFATNENGSWYMENGVLLRNQNTVIKDELGTLGPKGSWYYVVGSKVQYGFTGLANYKNDNGWYYITDGKVDRTYNGLAKNNNGWYYLTNGKVDRSYTGFAQNENGSWYVTKGKLTRNDNTVLQDENGSIGKNTAWYYVIGSKVQYDFTGLANYKNASGWWYITNGKVDRSVNTVAKNKNGWYYVVNGKVQKSFTGLANYKNEHGWWYIKNGKLDRSYTGLAKNVNGWYYLTNGKVNRSYTGLATNSNGTWYVKNGKVQKSFTGTVTINGTRYSVTNGKVSA